VWQVGAVGAIRRLPGLVAAGEFHAIAGLNAGDDHGVILDVEIGAKDLNIDEFAFLGRVAIGAEQVELLVAVMRADEAFDCRVHVVLRWSIVERVEGAENR